MSTTFNLAETPAAQGISLRQILSLLQTRRWQVAGISLSVLAGAALELAPPLLVQNVVDQHLAPGRPDGLGLLAALYLLASGGAQGLSFVTGYLTALAAQGVLHELRIRLFAHLQKLPLAYYDQTPLGDIISRCTADVEAVDTLFSSGVASLLADLLRLVSVVLAMVALSPLLSLVSALAVPPLWVLTNFFRIRVRDAERHNRQKVGGLNTHLQETLSGIEVIRAFGREDMFAQRFRQVLRESLAALNGAIAYSALYTPLMAILSSLVVAVLLWVGTLQTLGAWNISLGTLVAFVLLFRRFFAPVTALGDEWQTVQSALSGAERIFQVLRLPVDAPAPLNPSPLERPTQVRREKAAIELRRVTFGYSPDQPILHAVSLSVHAGEQVALVGRTGAGKTSLLHLLAGMYTPWAGAVRVAGRDPRQLPDAERCVWIGVVPQTVQLFSGTIRHNLTLGDSSLTHADVERAASITGAADFINALPHGYETQLGVGNGSAQLSAGQLQLLALTRALVWNPPALLLDEGTALVDSATEAAFRAALRAERQAARAVLIIAHRLATAREADRVSLLEAGQIIEEGPPDELISRNGRFAQLLALEAAGWDWRQVN